MCGRPQKVSQPSLPDLLAERGATYGEAWAMTGKILAPLAVELARLHKAFPEAWYPWIMIVCKLFRILTSPKHLDSWNDIAGYARLVVEHLEKEES